MKRLYNFNNKVKVFLDTETLPEGVSADEAYKLNGRHVVYAINVPNGMIYIGYTSDLGQRMVTHGKCGRDYEKKMYSDIRKYGECTFSIIGVFDNQKEAMEYETQMIREYENKFLKDKFKEMLPLVPVGERDVLLFSKLYNVNKR